MKHKAAAFLAHLALSVAVLATALGLAVSRWYPPPYFWLDGGWPGLRLLLLFGAVLGPLLTAVAYHPAKSNRKLFWDLAMVGTLQGAVVLFGAWTVYSQRTVLVVFADGAFYTLNQELASAAGPRAAALIARAEATPAYGVIRLSSVDAEVQRLRLDALRTGRPLFLGGEFLEPLDGSTFRLVAAGGVDLDRWNREARGRADAVRRARERFPGGEKEYAFVPTVARYGTLLLVYRRATGELAGNVEVSRGP